MIHYSDEEIEQIRLAAIAAHGADEDADENWLKDLEEMAVPGSFGMHEALHTTWIQLESVEKFLLEHSAIMMDKEAFRMAHHAHTTLFNLYQHIGGKHLNVIVDDSNDG